MSLRLSALLLAGSLPALAALPSLPFHLPTPHLPVLPASIERWLWNPRAETNAAIADAQQKDKASRERAVREADTAVRLAPDDSLVQYDAGTVHLTAGDPRGAAGLLDRAAKGLAHAGPDLAAAASYNQGNAQLADSHFDPAIAAYRQALRADPANANAKWNLELALRQRQDQMQMKGPNGSRGGSGGGNTPSPSPGNEQPGKKDEGTPDPGKSQQPAGGEANRGGAQGQPQPRPGDQPLPQFKNQPDMSAAEAAALLESVENLERQQRRAQAAQRAQRRAAKGKDW
ncbi:MAG TPA: tetratricopeptide repeat protein [Thermoanaerobaculia bacterium]|nr:tetratricopeptide repeat protein [Thermoanaerobaculia bacterium]